MVSAIGFSTLAHREVKRTLRVINQAIWPPLISTLLYLVVFGMGLGRGLHLVDGMPYLTFLAPGLVAMNVIETSFNDSADSLFVSRFTDNIQELLVAPLAHVEMVAGFVTGALARALVIGSLILGLSWVVAGVHPVDWGRTLLVMAGVSVAFAAIGLAVGLFADSFDQLAIPATFLLTPLMFLGGVFNSVQALPERFQAIARFNPLFYLIDAFRTAITGHGEAAFGLDLGVMGGLMLLGISVTYGLFRNGYKLRS